METLIIAVVATFIGIGAISGLAGGVAVSVMMPDKSELSWQGATVEACMASGQERGTLRQCVNSEMKKRRADAFTSGWVTTVTREGKYAKPTPKIGWDSIGDIRP